MGTTTSTITGQDDRGLPATVTVTTTVPDPPPPPRMLVGVNVQQTDYDATFSAFPGARYCRVFFKPGEGLRPWSVPRLAGLPAAVLPHVSFKDWPSDATAIGWVHAWLDGMPDYLTRAPLIPGVGSAALTWHHEPEGDGIPVVEYQRRWALLDAAVRAHPNGPLVAAVPIQTRYWAAAARKGGGSPFGWWAGSGTGAAFDAYADFPAQDYPDPARFVDIAFRLAAGTGRPLWVPELGAVRLASDTDGQGRAAWMTEVVRLLREGGCVAVGWWHQFGSSGYDYRLDDAASAAWAEAMSA